MIMLVSEIFKKINTMVSHTSHVVKNCSCKNFWNLEMPLAIVRVAQGDVAQGAPTSGPQNGISAYQ